MWGMIHRANQTLDCVDDNRNRSSSNEEEKEENSSSNSNNNIIPVVCRLSLRPTVLLLVRSAVIAHIARIWNVLSAESNGCNSIQRCMGTRSSFLIQWLVILAFTIFMIIFKYVAFDLLILFT